MATVFPGAIIARPKDPLLKAKPFDPPNLLLGTLSLSPLPATTPFTPYDFHDAVRPTYKAKSFDAANPLLLQANVPFAQYDWPKPAAPKFAARIEIPPNLLLTTLAAVVAANPFQNTDFPKVARAAVGNNGRFDPPNLLLSTLQPVTPPPVVTQLPTYQPIQIVGRMMNR